MDRASIDGTERQKTVEPDSLEGSIVSTMRRYFEGGSVKHRTDLEEKITDSVKRYFEGKPVTP